MPFIISPEALEKVMGMAALEDNSDLWMAADTDTVGQEELALEVAAMEVEDSGHSCHRQIRRADKLLDIGQPCPAVGHEARRCDGPFLWPLWIRQICPCSPQSPDSLCSLHPFPLCLAFQMDLSLPPRGFCRLPPDSSKMVMTASRWPG